MFGKLYMMKDGRYTKADISISSALRLNIDNESFVTRKKLIC